MRRADGREVSLAEIPLAQTLGAGETVRAEEVVLSVPDGRSVRTLINATPIRAEGDAITSVVVTMQDLAPLVEIDRMRTEFLSRVSHELRAPLIAIKGSADALLEEGPSSTRPRCASSTTSSPRSATMRPAPPTSSTTAVPATAWRNRLANRFSRSRRLRMQGRPQNPTSPRATATVTTGPTLCSARRRKRRNNHCCALSASTITCGGCPLRRWASVRLTPDRCR